jgi:tetratricopeptide (TPR) repeat protein
MAAEAFEKAYRLDPESARDGLVAVHRDLGVTLENEGRFDKARPHFQRVLDITPDDPGARVRMRDSWRATAGAHLAAGRWDKAAEAYREALRYAPEDTHLRQAVATLEQRQIEAETVQRRRQQLERAVLEARLNEERANRERLEAEYQRALAILVAITAGAGLASGFAVNVTADAPASGLLPAVVGASLIAVYATYAWATRNLS